MILDGNSLAITTFCIHARAQKSSNAELARMDYDKIKNNEEEMYICLENVHMIHSEENRNTTMSLE